MKALLVWIGVSLVAAIALLIALPGERGARRSTSGSSRRAGSPCSRRSGRPSGGCPPSSRRRSTSRRPRAPTSARSELADLEKLGRDGRRDRVRPLFPPAAAAAADRQAKLRAPRHRPRGLSGGGGRSCSARTRGTSSARTGRDPTRPRARGACPRSRPSPTPWSACEPDRGRRALERAARRGRARGRRQARGARARPARAPRRRPRPDRGLPRPGEDADRAVVRAGRRPRLLPHPVHAGPDALRRDRLLDLRPAHRRRSSSGPGRSSPTSSSPTRSTAPRRRRRPRCSRRCRSGR